LISYGSNFIIDLSSKNGICMDTETAALANAGSAVSFFMPF
jgi:hypothetical protein